MKVGLEVTSMSEAALEKAFIAYGFSRSDEENADHLLRLIRAIEAYLKEVNRERDPSGKGSRL